MIRISFLITFLALFLFGNSSAQTIVKGIVMDASNETIPFAAVYLSKTTIGTMTNKDGAFSLTIPLEGEYELIASFIGYKTYSKTISAEGKILNINIKLAESPILLTEITVKSRDRNRETNYTLFNKLFLGETINAANCKILNPEDLYLFRDPNSETLKGHSLKSLRIENKSLGYTIVYDLADFAYDAKNGLLKFTGSNYFILMQGNEKVVKKWERNRLTAYYGSRLHFFRTLYLDSLQRENFQIYQCDVNTANRDTLKITPIRADSLRLSKNAKFMLLYSAKPIFVSYLDTHADLYSGLFGFQKQRFKTTLDFAKPLKVFANGFFPNPYDVTWFGEMAKERIADMLPFDFLPHGSPVVKSEPIFTTSSVEDYLTAKQKSSCRDQLYVHLDRNVYQPGDTLFFQAYIRDKFSGNFESKSAALYALLTNEKRLLVDSSRYKISNSTASGWMIIPQKSEVGKYHLTAFTSSMQNNDPIEAFQLDLYVKELTSNQNQIKMVFKKEKYLPGDTTDATLRISDSINFSRIDLRFLPEGGTFIEGVEQRVGFNATNFMGEPIEIEGLLKNTLGSVLDTIRSGPFGPGSFVCTARSGLYVELTKGAGSERIWPLPDPSITGISLTVSLIEDNSFAIDIQSNAYVGESVTVSGTLNLVQFFSQDVKLTQKQRIMVNTSTLPAGVATITLFNKELKPVAERLVYLNSNKRLQFNIKPEKQIVRTGEENELAITVTDGEGKPSEGFFSVSVTDSVRGIAADLFAPGIEYTYNYHPFFPGNLPAKVLAKGVENLTPDDRDLLLMVYGWSRISWDLKSTNPEAFKLINYDLLKLKLLYANKKNKADRSLDLFSLEGASSRHLVTDQFGEITLPLDSLSEITRSVILMPDVKNKNKATGVMLSIPYNEQYFKSEKLFIRQPILPIKKYIVAASDRPIAMEEKTIEIAEVTVIGHQNDKVYRDEYEKMYQANNVKSLDSEPLWSSSTLETAIRKLIYPYKITTDNIYLHSTRTILKGPVPALIVLDGMALYDQGWPRVCTISPSEVTSLTIMDGKNGFIRYGEFAQGGVIYINTRSSNPNLIRERTNWNLQNKKDNMLVPISLYRPHVEFYNPTRSELERDPLLQSRATIFWQSEVYFGGKDPVRIKFPNLKHAGPVVITVNGVSVNNLVGSGKGRYEVQ